MEGLAVTPDFWKGRRVLLTGHTGFKGSWLSLWLQSLGVRLCGYSLAPPTTPNLFIEASVASGMHDIEGDIRDLGKLRSIMKAKEPEVVIHMAAQSLVRHSYRHPIDTFSTNVMGTANVLEAVRNTPSVRAVVIVTTDKCYENKNWVWGYREADRLGGHDPYSSSKACAELVSAAYQRSFFDVTQYEHHRVGIATVRAGNVIGGGDWSKDRLIPDIIAAYLDGRPVQIRNPDAIRPWQHVLEPLRGYLCIAERLVETGPAYTGSWNFGPLPGDARPVAWIAEQMSRLWGEGASWIHDSQDHPYEEHALALDISKAEKLLDWTPRLSLKEALDLTVQWAKSRESNACIKSLCLNQILTYQNSTVSDPVK